MKHIKQQIRDGVKSVLSSIPELTSVHSESRLLRYFQRDEFPVALVSVSENIQTTSNLPAGNRVLQRNMNIGITLAAHGESVNAEDELDTLSIAVEKALVLPSNIGAGLLLFWNYNGSTSTSASASTTEDGTLIAQTLNFSCTVRTKDTDPTININ